MAIPYIHYSLPAAYLTWWQVGRLYRSYSSFMHVHWGNRFHSPTPSYVLYTHTGLVCCRTLEETDGGNCVNTRYNVILKLSIPPPLFTKCLLIPTPFCIFIEYWAYTHTNPVKREKGARHFLRVYFFSHIMDLRCCCWGCWSLVHNWRGIWTAVDWLNGLALNCFILLGLPVCRV